MRTKLGLDENIEAMLTYVLGWITGIAFLVLEKESEFVRFHAAQSTITFLAFTIVSVILGHLSAIPLIGLLFLIANTLLGILAAIVWIVCIIKAFQGERFRLPIVGDLVEKQVR
ncbi:MAG: DUF4870 domain-containing protein [Syntrophobacterales bacterium]|nr:DUF4870 domain-containing protein [Syntrophobacterales bacterium]